jgi:hypothetical protein
VSGAVRGRPARCWDATVEEPKNGYSITLAPLVVKNKVIVGVSLMFVIRTF